MGNKVTKSEEEEAHPLGGSTPIIGLHDKLLRKQSGRDPQKIYDVVEILGVGSMGSVSKVKKKESVLGGSARSSFVQSFHDNHAGVCFRIVPFSWCFGKGSSSLLPKKDALVTPESSNGPAENPRKLYRKTSSLITFNHKETYFALKSIILDKTGSAELKEELRNEVAILKTLDHPNIVTPLETFEYKRQLCIVMELCSGGDLYARDPYTEREAARLTTSLLSAIAYMHSRHITHRDLKYENIMFVSQDPMADIKIIDFGLSKKYGDNENMHDAVGTIYSMSPEVLRSDYSSKSDVWSTGVLLFMLLSSSMPFYGRSRKHVMQKILRGTFAFKGRVWKYISDEAKDFVTELLNYEPKDRPTAEKALENPWLSTQNDLLAPEVAKMDIVQATVENYASYGTLKRLALMVIAYQSTSEEIGYLRRMFKKYDLNKDGDMSLEEYRSVLAEYDYEDDDIERMFHAMDLDRTGSVHYSEFLAATIEAHGNLDEERLAEAFDRMDCDDSGYITVRNLADMLGKEVKKSYLDAIIDEADTTRDHRISYEEFLALWANEEEEINRKRTLERITKRRLGRQTSSTVSPSSSISDSDFYLEVERLTADPSEFSDLSDRDPISGTFLFQQEKAKSVRSFADI